MSEEQSHADSSSSPDLSGGSKGAKRKRSRSTTKPAGAKGTPSPGRAGQIAAKQAAAKKALFVQKLAQSGLITWSCTEAGLSRSAYYRYLEDDEDFAVAVENAQHQAAGILEKEVLRRGVTGWLEPVYQKGSKIGTIRRFSDRMLELAIRANPVTAQQYTERRKVEHSGAVGGASNEPRSAEDIINEINGILGPAPVGERTEAPAEVKR